LLLGEDVLKRFLSLAGLLLLLCLSPARATPPDGPEGTWEGFLTPRPLAEVRLILRVEKGSAGALRAKIESPELKSQPTIEFDEVDVKERAVVLRSKQGDREFRGVLNPSGTELVGDLKRGKSAMPVTFTRLDEPVIPADTWEGTLEVNGGIKIRLVFHALKPNAP
jgi:hypothetical protein